MALSSADRRPPGKRRRRWLRLGVWTIALLWLAHYAYVRITTPPAAVARQQRQPAVAAPEHNELLELIAELPVPPAPPPLQTTGGWWGIWCNNVLAAGLVGQWSPDPNSAQDIAIKYVNKPTTSKTLDRIVTCCAQLEQAPAPPSGQPPDPRYQDAICALSFRARYRTTENADVAGALADLRAAARIAAVEEQNRSSGMWWGERSPLVVQYQLGCLTREVDIPGDLAREMIAYLTDRLSLSVADVVIANVHAGMQVDNLLDRFYTDDGDGNGWLVLSAASDQMTLFYGSPSTPRSRAWNVFSPLFNNRKTMRAKLLSLTDDLQQLDQMSYSEATRFLANRQQSGRGGSVVDGPLLQLAQGVDEYTFMQLFDQVAKRRALVIMLALSAHKHEHGAYPNMLDALKPVFLSDVPMDAPSAGPFQYQILPDSDYDLCPGSVGGDAGTFPYHQWHPGGAYRTNSYVPQRSSETD